MFSSANLDKISEIISQSDKEKGTKTHKPRSSSQLSTFFRPMKHVLRADEARLIKHIGTVPREHIKVCSNNYSFHLNYLCLCLSLFGIFVLIALNRSSLRFFGPENKSAQK